MTIAAWLVGTMKVLGAAGVDSPRRDALVLLEDTLQKDRAWVLAHPEHELASNDLQAVQKLIQQRVDRVPLAYIRGKAWFYGRFFTVNSKVLIPRPESESFIELLIPLVESRTGYPTVIDIGTGSGALAITAKLELPSCPVIATDNDAAALQVAKKNAHTHGTDIQFVYGSLLEPLNTKQLTDSVVITNLPYVPNTLVTSPEISTEPSQALFSGDDGLNHYREFWHQVTNLPNKPKYILTESLNQQHESLTTFASAAGYQLQQTDILIQVFMRV